jgi:uncharacterized protein (DUF2249 family)
MKRSVGAPKNFKKIDVRKLVGRGLEPFPEIRKEVDALESDQGLTVIAHFLPSPLIEKLRSEGFSCRTEHRADGSWMTQFWRD